jgi:threonine dehydratase
VNLPTHDDVLDAARLIDGKAVVTPLLENEALNERAGGRLLFKAEPLQRTGSFKFRGAYNCIARLSPEERRRGVVAYSSGNHAQGVATAARMLGVPATIVMPADAPALKIERTRAAGADVRLYDRWTEDREAIAEAIRSERGGTMVPPFEHPHIISGQGTIGLEVMRQARDMGAEPDIVVAPCSGGGLAAGIALGAKGISPNVEVWLAEPRDFDDAGRSLRAGERQKAADGGRSICDALLSPQMGAITFAVGRELLAGGLSASDAEVAETMRTLFIEIKLVVEPGGACAAAALLTGKLPLAGRTAVVVLSGGNVGPELFAEVLRGER